MTRLHKHIRSTDPRANHADLYTAPAQPAAEDELAELLAVLVYNLKPDRVLETGTAFGHTASHIGRALHRNGVGHLDTIERLDTRADKAEERTQGLPVTIHRGEYATFTPARGTRYDLAFLDATRDTRDEEFLHFRPWIRAGALVLFHDCGEQHPGQAGVNRLKGMGLIESVYIPTPRGASLAQVL